MKYVIWGAGVWGKRIKKLLKNYSVDAFIDNNKSCIGKVLMGCPVISLEEYIKIYSDHIIIIAIWSECAVKSIEIELNQKGIYQYVALLRCPSEIIYPSNACNIPFELMLTENRISITDKIAIDGITLFSLLLYEYLLKNKCDVSFISNDEQIEMKLKDIDGTYNFLLKDIAEKDCDKILVTNKHNMLRYLDDDKKVVSFFRFANLKCYHNKEIEKLRDIYNGKRCFIVATGPSLKLKDLDCLAEHNEICFSMNEVFKVFSFTRWRPDCYVTYDPEVPRLYRDVLLKMDIPYMFIGDWNVEFWDNNPELKNIYKYHPVFEFYDAEGPLFSDDVASYVFDGYTVVYNCLQIAIYMGVKKIYIIGADCETKPNLIDNHFIKNYGNKLQKQYVIFWDKIFKGYEKAKEYAKMHGIEIYNATRGGKLEVFERVNFDSLFKK